MTDGSDDDKFARDMINVHGREAATVARGNARAAALAQRLGLAPVTAAAASFRNQASRTFDPIGLQQPKHLTSLEPEQLSRGRGRQPLPIQILQHLKPPQLPIAHG
jgi:hypothetical protein